MTTTTSAAVFPIRLLTDHDYYNVITRWCLDVYYNLRGPVTPCISGTLMEFGKFVWIHNKEAAQTLYEQGSFGKGSLSRSNPTWFTRTVDQDKNALEEITVLRRQKRRQKGKEVQLDLLSPLELLNLTDHQDVEYFQLDFYESFFLKYGLNVLSIKDTQQNELSLDNCWSLFNTYDPRFNVNYAVYHYYRSLGWVPKNGSKFGVDFVLYKSGPSFRHADYAVVIVPMYENQIEEPKNWSWFLRLNRVITQVKKTLILCHVHVPLITDNFSNLNEYSIREVIYKRWSPQKNRE